MGNRYVGINHVRLELDGRVAVGRSHASSDYIAIGTKDTRVLMDPTQVMKLIETVTQIQADIRAGIREDARPAKPASPNPTNTLEAYTLLGAIARKLGL